MLKIGKQLVSVGLLVSLLWPGGLGKSVLATSDDLTASWQTETSQSETDSVWTSTEATTLTETSLLSTEPETSSPSGITSSDLVTTSQTGISSQPQVTSFFVTEATYLDEEIKTSQPALTPLWQDLAGPTLARQLEQLQGQNLGLTSPVASYQPPAGPLSGDQVLAYLFANMDTYRDYISLYFVPRQLHATPEEIEKAKQVLETPSGQTFVSQILGLERDWTVDSLADLPVLETTSQQTTSSEDLTSQTEPSTSQTNTSSTSTEPARTSTTSTSEATTSQTLTSTTSQTSLQTEPVTSGSSSQTEVASAGTFFRATSRPTAVTQSSATEAVISYSQASASVSQTSLALSETETTSRSGLTEPLARLVDNFLESKKPSQEKTPPPSEVKLAANGNIEIQPKPGVLTMTLTFRDSANKPREVEVEKVAGNRWKTSDQFLAVNKKTGLTSISPNQLSAESNLKVVSTGISSDLNATMEIGLVKVVPRPNFVNVGQAIVVNAPEGVSQMVLTFQDQYGIYREVTTTKTLKGWVADDPALFVSQGNGSILLPTDLVKAGSRLTAQAKDREGLSSALVEGHILLDAQADKMIDNTLKVKDPKVRITETKITQNK